MKAMEIDALNLIAQERQRQRDVGGWTDERDDGHVDGSLALVAAQYAAPEDIFRNAGDGQYPAIVYAWPFNWDIEWDKKDIHPRMKQLQIAGALIVAEMERISRAELCE